ncbi:hypothetical protein KEM56_001718 [Ascosphaera pollenicola]|nr:hypothetical protein KEM56_001718 [Ascosphaera pollenicola]
MGFLKRFTRFATVTTASGWGGYWYLFGDSKFVPMSRKDDDLFSSPYYKKYNPKDNATTHDLCVRRVPLEKLDKTLLKDGGKDGKLAQAFCSSVWGGLGYAFQRFYLAQRYQNPTTSHQLWDTSALRTSSYKVGTQITDHFEVVEKSPTRIIVRCGDSPLNKDVRASDGLFEMSAVVKEDEGVAEFGLKSIFFTGTGDMKEKGPMPPFIVFLHRQYDRILIETAIWRLMRG